MMTIVRRTPCLPAANVPTSCRRRVPKNRFRVTFCEPPRGFRQLRPVTVTPPKVDTDQSALGNREINQRTNQAETPNSASTFPSMSHDVNRRGSHAKFRALHAREPVLTPRLLYHFTQVLTSECLLCSAPQGFALPYNPFQSSSDGRFHYEGIVREGAMPTSRGTPQFLEGSAKMSRHVFLVLCTPLVGLYSIRDRLWVSMSI